jgi:hypothetical protein
VALKKRDALVYKPEPFPIRVDVCFYETDAQCQNIGGEGLCNNGACDVWSTCEAGCCFRTNWPRE